MKFLMRLFPGLLKMENNNEPEVKKLTAAQDMLAKKILKSSKLKDIEYKILKNIYSEQVVTSYDASIFIEYVLSTLKFRRTFLNGKHKAYKKCLFCRSRDNVSRYHDADSGKKIWLCETCGLNSIHGKLFKTKIQEVNEVKVELQEFNRNKKLTPSQEDLVCEHREQ